jgi:hypothetical protein
MIWLFCASELNYSNFVAMILLSWENELLLTFSTDNVVIMGKWVITYLSCTKFLLKKITFSCCFYFYTEICFDSLLPTDIYLLFSQIDPSAFSSNLYGTYCTKWHNVIVCSLRVSVSHCLCQLWCSIESLFAGSILILLFCN